MGVGTFEDKGTDRQCKILVVRPPCSNSQQTLITSSFMPADSLAIVFVTSKSGLSKLV
jgi:hypothetical protein